MNWTEQQLQAIWEKGLIAEKTNPRKWRKDVCGAWICRDHHGNTQSSFGWDVDHIVPAVKGGGDELSNLRPVQWKNLAAREQGKRGCPVIAHGGINADFSGMAQPG